MTRGLLFHPAAREEIREARSWYEKQLPGLGRAFIAELEASLSLARFQPEMYATIGADETVRRALLHRFPYSVVYEILPSTDLLVLACRHMRQSGVDWLTRHKGSDDRDPTSEI